jgi:uncharacterized protein
MKFLVDRMLGKLAKKLRILGYDTVYYQGKDPDPLIQMARREGRTVLTRNSSLISGTSEFPVIGVSEDDPHLQLKALIGQGWLSRDQAKPFSRCLPCNALLHRISSAEAEGKVPDFVFYHQKEFFRCPECGRIYWKGSHQENMENWVEELFHTS